MANLTANSSRLHALALRNAFRSGNYQRAESDLADLKASLPQFSCSPPFPRPIKGMSSLLLPEHTYIHGVLRNRLPFDLALREVGWMLARGFRVRERTLQAVLSLGKEGERKEIEERSEPPQEVLVEQDGTKGDASEMTLDMLEDEHLGTAAKVLRLVRANDRTGPTMVTVEMYRSLVLAHLKKDEFVAASLVFEMMIEDWAGWLPSAAAAAAPAATKVPSSVSDVTPGKQSLRQPKGAPLMPLEFADRSDDIFHKLCARLKHRLFLNFAQRDTTEMERLQSQLAVCIIASLLNRGILPYYKISKLLSAISLGRRGPSCRVLVRTGGLTDSMPRAVNSHLYLRDTVISLVEDLSSTNLSSIPEISELFRSRILLLPNFSLLSYRTLLFMVFKYHDPMLASKVIHHMVRDDETRRKSLDTPTCQFLTHAPRKLKLLGLDNVAYNYVWNKAGVALAWPTAFSRSPIRSIRLEHKEGNRH